MPTTAGLALEGDYLSSQEAMQESISQRDSYGDAGMHFMASHAVYKYTQSHDNHLSLQECMRHPVAFHMEMMGGKMHLHQALQQPNAPQLVQAVSHGIHGHIEMITKG